jgi:hypothetical protein
MQKSICIFLFVSIIKSGFSQESPENILTKKNGINIGFVGIQNSISINYEHLFDSINGLVIGIPLINIHAGREYGLSLNYRRHLIVGMKSSFWGLFINYSNVRNNIRNNKNMNEYNFKYTSISFGPDIGLRWVEKSGLNIALRFGYGIPITKFEWLNSPPDKRFANNRVNAFKIISGIDDELTLGYCF